MLGLGNSLSQAGSPEAPALVTNTYSEDFDGADDFIKLPQGVITSTGDFTFACWFKYDTTSGHKCLANFHSTSANDGMQIIMQGSYDELDVSIRAASDAEFSYRTSTEFSTDTWYHIVATKTANNIGTVYINGVADSGTTGGTWSAKGEDAIGSRKTSAYNNGWNGHLDEMAIWNSVLSATEAKALYDNVRLDLKSDSVGYASSSDLAGWWRMGDGTLDDENEATFSGSGNGLIGDEHVPTTGLELLDETSSFTDGAWDDGAQIAFSGGNIVFTRSDDGDGTYTTQILTETNPFTVIAEGVYKISFTVANRTAGRITPKIGNAAGAGWVTTNGAQVSYIIADNTTEFQMVMHSTEGFVGEISALSVRKIGGVPGMTAGLGDDSMVTDVPS